MRYTDLETQFRDHQWGSRKSLIEDTFLKEGHDFTKRSHVIIYKDTIIGEESDVHLYFTPKSKMLYKAVVSMINISSYKAMQKVQNILVAKYGLPEPRWFNENGGVFRDWDFDKYLIRTSILLHPSNSYSFGVTYISKHYYNIYKLEELKKRKEVRKMTNTNNEKTVLCKWCDEPTSMLGTEECNRCWEVTSRLSSFLRSQKARDFVRQILLSREETIYFRYIRDPFDTQSKEQVDKEYKKYYQRIQVEDQEPLSFDEWCDAVEYIPVKR